MTRNKTHEDQVVRWAKYFKSNPEKARKELNLFINAQINMANDFYKRLSLTPLGKEKISELRKLKIDSTSK